MISWNFLEFSKKVLGGFRWGAAEGKRRISSRWGASGRLRGFWCFPLRTKNPRPNLGYKDLFVIKEVCLCV